MKIVCSALVMLAMASVDVRAENQKLPLDGVWRQWVDAVSYVDVVVPFSRDPSNSLIGYQRLFSVSPGVCNALALLRFDHIVGQASVYLNGTFLGTGSSYLPFYFDVSSVLNGDGENDLIVTIDDRRDLTTVPYEDIAWVNYSGISGSVYLECNPVPSSWIGGCSTI